MERIIEQLATVCGKSRFFAVLNALTAIILAVIFYVQLTFALITAGLPFSQYLKLLIFYYSIPGTVQLLISYLIYRFCNSRLAIWALMVPVIASLLNFFVTPPIVFVSEAYFLIVNFIYTAVYGWRRELFIIYLLFLSILIQTSPFPPLERTFYVLTLLFILVFSTISGFALNVFLRLLEVNHHLDSLSPIEVKRQLEVLLKKLFPSLDMSSESVVKKAGKIKNPLVSIPLNHFIHKVSEKMKLLEEIERKRRREQEIIALLSIVEELKDPYTRGHSLNVASYSELIGREMGLRDGEINTLKTAALLHDIGKLSVPDWILLKPTPLTEDEFRFIKLHTVIGEKLLSQIEGFEEVAKIVRWHHEKIDGSGYPDGLKGDEIPLFARIIAVADIYDALTSDRPYRKALSSTEALSLLEKMPLDREVVDVAKRVLPGQLRKDFPITFVELEELDRYKKVFTKRTFIKGKFPGEFCIFQIEFRDEAALMDFLNRLSSLSTGYLLTLPTGKTSQLVVCDKSTEKSLLSVSQAVKIERIV